jgi:hypothetical protein
MSGDEAVKTADEVVHKKAGSNIRIDERDREICR